MPYRAKSCDKPIWGVNPVPKITTEIPEVEESIKRPVVYDVIRRILRETGLSPLTDVQYAGDAGSIPQVGSTLDDSSNPSANEVKLPSDNRVFITVTEEYPEETGMTLEVNRPDVPVFFNDPDLSVYMKPVYEQTVFTISIKFKARTRTEADIWRNNLYRQIGKMHLGYLHEVQYHYPIPPAFVLLLTVIHGLREANLPLNEDIGAYIRRCMDPRFTVITNQAGNNPTLVLRESQICVVGNYELQDSAKFEREDVSNLYETSIDYTFTMDVCHQCWMEYPLMVHNQLIPDTFYFNPWPIDWREFIQQTSMSKNVFDIIASPWQWQVGGIQGISIPYFDDWLPAAQPPNSIMIARILLQVDPANPMDIINLSQLGDFAFEADALAYIQSSYQGLNTPNGSLYKLMLYRGLEPMDQSLITVDSTLNVRATYNLDPTSIYHLLISFNSDLIGLSDAALANLLKQGAFCQRILTILSPALYDQGLIPTLNAEGTMSQADFLNSARAIALQMAAAPANAFRGPSRFNIASMFIVANRSQ